MGCTENVLNPQQTGLDAQRLESDLRQRIVGQEDAIQQIIQIYQTNLAGLSSTGRPIANLLFLGPTGTGKTRLVEALAESLVGEARAVIKIDCGEFQHSHEIAKLIGSPPGYLGHRETQPMLSQQTLNQHHTDRVKMSFLLFDEIEKASDSLWHLLLGILDKGTLTLGDNRRVDFSQTLIFMTSNLGALEMSTILQPRIGFASADAERRLEAGLLDQALNDQLTRSSVEAARRKFSPEFINRLDRIVVFRPLGPAELTGILSIEIDAVQERIFRAANASPFVITVTEPARSYLLSEGTDLKYGARHLKRAIDRFLVNPLSNLIATGQISGGDLIRIDFDGVPGRLTFFKDASRSSAVMARNASQLGAGEGASPTEAAREALSWLTARPTRR